MSMCAFDFVYVCVCALPTGFHHYPNLLLNTFHIRKVIACSCIWSVPVMASNNVRKIQSLKKKYRLKLWSKYYWQVFSLTI